MPFNSSGITTGLLGYTLRKEILGEGLYYRETELYNWEVYARPQDLQGTPYSEVEAHIKNAFAGYSGDITVKALDTPADYQFPNDHIRVGKFNVAIEIKKPILNLGTFNSELETDRYKGINASFFSTYGTYIEGFNEDFSFETKDGGINVYGHNISFSLLSGGREKANQIATTIYEQDKNTTLGVNIFANGVVIADTGNYLNFYNETYDLAKNSFSFSKRRESLPATGSTYLYDLNHSIVYKGDGFIDVSEKGIVNGKLLFNQTKSGFEELYAGAYNRCNNYYSDFKTTVAGVTVSESLVNFPINNSRTLNKLSNTIEYDISYTNDSNLISSSSTSLEKTTDIEKTEDGYINIVQGFNYSFLRTPVSGGNDIGYTTIIQAADIASDSEVSSIYSTSAFYNTSRPSMKRVKFNANTPNRKRQFSLSIAYTNNPIYFITLDATTYSILDFKVTDTKPVDIVTEYKIINRPNKSSIINYAYQTEKGSKNVAVTALLPRASGNIFSSPKTGISGNLLSLYKYAVGKALEDMKGISLLSLSYHLSDIKYSINSDNEINLNIVLPYAIKKHTE